MSNPLQQTIEALAKDSGSDKLATMFNADALYEGGEATALQLPTFVVGVETNDAADAVPTAPSSTSRKVMRPAPPGAGEASVALTIRRPFPSARTGPSAGAG